MANGISSIEAFNALKQSFESCRTTKVDYKKNSGFFVSSARIDELDERLQFFLATLDNDPAGLADHAMALGVELDKMRQSSAVAEAALAASKAEIVTLGKAHRETVQKMNSLIDEANKASDALKAEKARLQLELTKAKEDNETAKKNVKIAGKGFDPEAVVKADALKQEATVKLQSLQSDLERVNRALSTAVSEKDKALKEKNAARAALTAAELKNSEIQAARVEAMADTPPRKVEVAINAPALKLLLGEKGLNWVQKAAEKHEAEVREKVYNMMMALKGHKENRVISGIFDLLQVAFDWIKTQSYKARMAIQPWVSMIEEDLRLGVFKHLSYYRKELEKLLGELSVKAKKAKKQAKESFKKARISYFGWQWFSSEIVAWSRVLKHRAKRGLSRFSRSVKSFWDSWFKAKPGKEHSEEYVPITLFDYEEVDLPHKGDLKYRPPIAESVASSSRDA